MNHYDYLIKLEKVWEHGVEAYRKGVSNADEMFSDHEKSFLASIGQTAQEFFDYAEDYVRGSEPSFGDVAAVAHVRRAYFIEEQHGQASGNQVDPASLPGKKDEMHGVPWLPRIIRKAHAKLRGELHPDMMYGCGGDRNFLREHDIHPAELLAVARRHEDDDEAIAQWVLNRSKKVSHQS